MEINFTFSISKIISNVHLEALYNDAGWSSYTRNLVSLQKSIQNSQDVITVWDKEQLVGLLRTIGDTETILYIQDILILSEYKRQGIGRRLIEQVLALNQNCRQFVLLTEDNEESRGFYEALGFESCDRGSAVAFAMQK